MTDAPAAPRADHRARMWATAIFVAYLGAVVAQLATHELWLDEAQAWLIAAASPTPADLVRRLGYEGHPGLWYALLYVVTRVTTAPLALHALALGCAAGTGALIAWRAPLSLGEKALVLFGFFVVSDYAVFARSYGLGMLLLCVSAVVLSDRTRPRAWGFWLGLLLNTSFYGALAAGVLALDRLIEQRDARPHLLRQILWLGAAALLALVVMTPATDVSVASRGSRAFDVFAWLGQAVAISHGLVAPIPPWRADFWTFVAPLPAVFVLTWLGALVFSLSTLRRRAALFFLTLLFVTGFGYFVYGVFVRHVGTLWLLAVVLVWLDRAHAPLDRARRIAFAAVCAAHVVAAGVAVPQHLFRPLTRARDVAAWIDAHVPASAVVVIEDDRAGPAISAYLGGRPLVQLSRLEPSTYVVWDEARQVVPPTFVEANLAPLHEDYRDALFVLARDRGERLSATGLDLVRVAAFDGAVVLAENVWLYAFADGVLAPR